MVPTQIISSKKCILVYDLQLNKFFIILKNSKLFSYNVI